MDLIQKNIITIIPFVVFSAFGAVAWFNNFGYDYVQSDVVTTLSVFLGCLSSYFVHKRINNPEKLINIMLYILKSKLKNNNKSLSRLINDVEIALNEYKRRKNNEKSNQSNLDYVFYSNDC